MSGCRLQSPTWRVTGFEGGFQRSRLQRFHDGSKIASDWKQPNKHRDEKVTRNTCVRISQNISRPPWKMNMEHVKTTGYLCFRHLSTEVYQKKLLRLLRKINPKHLTCYTCDTESSSCPTTKWRQIYKRDLRPFYNVVHVHQTSRWPRKMVPKSFSHFDPRLPTF